MGRGTPNPYDKFQGKQRVDKWKEDVSRLSSQIHQLQGDIVIFRRITEIIKSNWALRDKSMFFYSWIRTLFAERASTSLRRLGDADRQSVSLQQLVNDMRGNSVLLSMNEFLRLFSEAELEDPHFGRGYWIRHYNDLWEYDNEDIDDVEKRERRLQQWVTELKAATEVIKKYVDMSVAHLDRRGISELPTYNDLFEAADTATRIYTEVRLRLLSQSDDGIPSIVAPWEDIFTVAWLAPGPPPGIGGELM